MRFGMVTNLKEDSFGFSMLMILKKQNQPKKTSYLFIKYLVYLSQMNIQKTVIA